MKSEISSSCERYTTQCTTRFPHVDTAENGPFKVAPLPSLSPPKRKRTALNDSDAGVLRSLSDIEIDEFHEFTVNILLRSCKLLVWNALYKIYIFPRKPSILTLKSEHSGVTNGYPSVANGATPRRDCWNYESSKQSNALADISKTSAMLHE